MNIKLTIILLTQAFFVSVISAAELGEIDISQLAYMQHEQNALVVDIRTEQEWIATGVIPRSHKLEFFDADGQYDTERWLDQVYQFRTSQDQPIVLICRSGNRSGRAGQILAQKLGIENVYHLKNGIVPWIQAGNALEKDCSKPSAC